MIKSIIFSGFGGQGILSAGRLVAYAAMIEGKNVSWLPSYGPEKRGGTSNCHVMISDEMVGSPYITEPDIVIAMSRQAFDKYESLIAKDGVFIYDINSAPEKVSRKDIKYYGIPGTQMAAEKNLMKFANMVFLGKLIGSTGIVEFESILYALKEYLPKEKHYLIPDEEKLMKMGMEHAS